MPIIQIDKNLNLASGSGSAQNLMGSSPRSWFRWEPSIVGRKQIILTTDLLQEEKKNIPGPAQQKDWMIWWLCFHLKVFNSKCETFWKSFVFVGILGNCVLSKNPINAIEEQEIIPVQIKLYRSLCKDRGDQIEIHSELQYLQLSIFFACFVLICFDTCCSFTMVP